MVLAMHMSDGIVNAQTSVVFAAIAIVVVGYAAVRARADVLLTGELRFHDYLAAQASGLALVLPGHYATERFGVEELARQLQGRWPELEVWASKRERDPVQWA